MLRQCGASAREGGGYPTLYCIWYSLCPLPYSSPLSVSFDYLLTERKMLFFFLQDLTATKCASAVTVAQRLHGFGEASNETFWLNSSNSLQFTVSLSRGILPYKEVCYGMQVDWALGGIGTYQMLP